MKQLMVLACALALVVSCSKGGGPSGNYVAKIDGTVITKEDAQREMNSLPPMAKEFFQGPDGTARFMDELVKKELLYLEAKKRGLDKNEDYKKKVEDFTKFTLINQLLEKEIESASKLTDKDLKDYYDSHKDEFTVSNQIRLSQIVVKTENDAKKAYERLEKGEDFSKVAKEMSVDKSGKTGGDLGYFKRGEMARELEDVAFRLKKGQTSQPIPLKDGIHILKVTDVKGTLMEFDKVKGLISQRLTADKQREIFDKLIENLKKNYKVELNKEEISKLTFAPPQAAPQQQAPQQQQKGQTKK